MQKPLLSILLLNYCVLTLGQPNYCKYFKLLVEESKFNGKIAMSISPEIITIDGDEYSTFLNNHKNRFEYILLNKLDSIVRYSKYYPDSLKIESEFCNYLNHNNKIKNYFSILSNENQIKIRFTKSEMMRIAARFFLCNRVNKIDTSVGYHICIGINGQKELKSQTDYSVLEAFCFEAIFSYMDKKKTPEFVTNFKSYISNSSMKHKKNYFREGEFLEKVKNECFQMMQKDKVLMKYLFKFYKRNKSNLGITIK